MIHIILVVLRDYRLPRLDDRVGGLRGDTALVSVVAAHLDVAALTPAGAPRVLDEPVVLSVLGGIADGQDGMVQAGGGAVRLIVHTARVQLERHLGGVDQNSDGSDGGDGIQQGALALGRHVHVAGESGHRVQRGLAGAVTSRVRIVSLRLDAVVTDVPVSASRARLG